ncbi:MAG: cation transporter [Desulfobulbaceae bacterium]|nr:cation transporter [Desulfobulbaceae bacterium]
MPTVKIKGMRCNHCVGSVTTALAAIDGISNVSVNLDKGEATYDETKPVGTQVIKDAIATIGFDIEP